jgi:tetratricopeptide (TPR) repeat protein
MVDGFKEFGTASKGLCTGFLMAMLALFTAGAARSEPFVPASDDVVVERLRDRPLDQTDRELRQLRSALRRAPSQLPLAIAVAQRCIMIARRDGDPRYIGYAEAALAPWWQRTDMPAAVRLLKAILLQNVHQFGQAMEELDVLLRHDPDNAQAWLTSASILQVEGRYAEAGAACEHLGAINGAPVYAQACLADLEGLRGDPTSAAAKLEDLRSANPGLASWLSLIEAELAVRRGQTQDAQRQFRLALSVANDAYTKGAYADFLLDQGRSAEVIDLLAGCERSDPLLLRLALAYQAQHDARLAGAVSDLQARFDAARLRGDRVHLREEARFDLELLHRPDKALPLALANWDVQKEPADMRILLATARAAGSEADVQIVCQFVVRNRISDVRLARYLK